MKRWPFLLLLVSGCTIIETFGDTEADGTTSDASSSTSGLLPTTAGHEDSTTSSGPASSSSSSTSGEEPWSDNTGCGFLGCRPPMDFPPECDPMLQDCPRGEKCNIFANDGGNAWNAAWCVPIVPDPALPDEACTTEGLGFDTCALGSVCAWIDADSGQGVCQPMCNGPDTSPSCDDPNRVCLIGGDAIPALCMSICDPLVQGCPTGLACYAAIGPPYTCGADWSEPDAAPLDPCRYANQCPVGSTCVGDETVGACPPEADRCCASFCDLAAPDCPSPLTCLPYATEPVPEGLESVGICGQG